MLSDPVITAIVGAIVTIALAIINRNISKLTTVAKDTHTLVNSNMEKQLQINAIVTRRLAVITKDPEDIKAADDADSLLREHVKKQTIVDSKDNIQ